MDSQDSPAAPLSLSLSTRVAAAPLSLSLSTRVAAAPSRRRPTQLAPSLTRAAAAVSQAVQNDAMNGDDAVRAHPARRALVAVVAMSGVWHGVRRLPSAPMALSVPAVPCRW